MIKINKGLDLPIAGSPDQTVSAAPEITSVAIVGPDYIGMKPTMQVREGDRVKLGQVIFTDKKTAGVQYTAPGAGVVRAINRGERRRLLSVVVDLDDQEEAIEFPRYSAEKLSDLSREQVDDVLINSGLWTAFRTRPFSRVPAIGTTPNSIFVTAMDTNPLAADPAVYINEQAEAFKAGLTILTRIGAKVVFLCHQEGKTLPSVSGVQSESFAGVHPAGNAGTHIHYLDPVSQQKTVWSIGYQDVIAIGKTFTEGRLFVERVVALGGPQVKEPTLLRTRVGASLEQLTEGRLKEGDNRVISGSVWNGRKAHGPLGYLSRYASQVSVLEEGYKRELFGFVAPGSDKFSVMNLFVSKLAGHAKRFNFTTSVNGSARSLIEFGQFEKIMPLDILPSPLLRALVTEDIVLAMQLGCLELDEEDLALCTYVCPGKYEYGPILRENLTRIEKEA